MDPYSSPYIIPTNNPYNPFPHSLLSTRESCSGSSKLKSAGGGDAICNALTHGCFPWALTPASQNLRGGLCSFSMLCAGSLWRTGGDKLEAVSFRHCSRIPPVKHCGIPCVAALMCWTFCLLKFLTLDKMQLTDSQASAFRVPFMD